MIKARRLIGKTQKNSTRRGAENLKPPLKNMKMENLQDKIGTTRDNVLRQGGVISQQIDFADKRGLVIFSRQTGAESMHLYKIARGLDNQGQQTSTEVLRAGIWSENFTTDELCDIIRKTL